jgi:hypothetical protein
LVEPTPGACLVRVRRRHYGGVKEACAFHLQGSPAKAGGGVMGGQLRASNMPSNRRAPGSWRRKASRLLRAHCPSRGRAQVGALVGSVGSKGVSSPSYNSETGDHGVLEQLRRRGTSSHLAMRRRMRGEGRSFALGGSAHAAHCCRFNPLSAQPAAGSRRCPQASSRRAVAVVVQLSGVLATPGSGLRRG